MTIDRSLTVATETEKDLKKVVRLTEQNGQALDCCGAYGDARSEGNPTRGEDAVVALLRMRVRSAAKTTGRQQGVVRNTNLPNNNETANRFYSPLVCDYW